MRFETLVPLLDWLVRLLSMHGGLVESLDVEGVPVGDLRSVSGLYNLAAFCFRYAFWLLISHYNVASFAAAFSQLFSR